MGEQGTALQAAALGEALLVGIAVGIYYDFFRIIRRIIHCRYANIVGQDIFFWVTTAIVVFFVTIKLNGGIVRIIFIALVLAGWLLYMATAGAVLMTAVDAVVRIVRKIYTRLHNILISHCEKNAKKRSLKQKTKKSD